MKIEDSVSISELSEKCRALLIENSNLKEEIRALKARLVIVEARCSGDELSRNESEFEIFAPQAAEVSPPGMSKNADEGEKIRLFMSLFKGRDDVYARRWENKKKGTSGYSPSCLNEWKPGLCVKPKGPCTGCIHKAYAALNEKVIDDHLRGKIVAGIYPMLPDETCRFDPAALTTLKTTIALNHGHLARRFVNALTNIPVSDLLAYHEQWSEHFTTMAKNEIGNRYSTYFSAIRVAAHVLLQDPGMDWMRPHLLPALYEVWDLATAEVSETDMAQKALHGLAGWIESNKRHFAVPGCQTELQPTFGTIRRDEGFIAILPHIFRQALRDIGIQSEAAALAEWKNRVSCSITPPETNAKSRLRASRCGAFALKRKPFFLTRKPRRQLSSPR